MKMELLILDSVKFLDLNMDELKSLNGGEVTRSSSVFYDVMYTVTYAITRSEIFTKDFWVEWGYAIL